MAGAAAAACCAVYPLGRGTKPGYCWLPMTGALLAVPGDVDIPEPLYSTCACACMATGAVSAPCDVGGRPWSDAAASARPGDMNGRLDVAGSEYAVSWSDVGEAAPKEESREGSMSIASSVCLAADADSCVPTTMRSYAPLQSQNSVRARAGAVHSIVLTL